MVECLPRSVSQTSRFTRIVNNHISDWMIIASGLWNRATFITTLSCWGNTGQIRLLMDTLDLSFPESLHLSQWPCFPIVFAVWTGCSTRGSVPCGKTSDSYPQTLITANYLAGTRLIYVFRYELMLVLLLCLIKKAVRLKSCWLKQAIMQISLCTMNHQVFILYVILNVRNI